MKTIVIPQFYRGPSGQKGLYNRQEVGLARAFAALGCRAVVLYPEPGAKAPRIETPEPNVKICYMPAVAFGVQAFYKSWQILLDEHAGNAGLAKGGSGDILAGLTAGLLAAGLKQGRTPEDAAVCAVWLHGAAADRCAKRRSMTAMLPGDLFEDLGWILGELGR